MKVWNREDLYAGVWEQPLVKLAAKYGISAVALGKVCRKLQIPLPGRGYRTKKEFGKPVERPPLPEARNLPVVRRMERSNSSVSAGAQEVADEPTPTDPEWLRIAEVEAHRIEVAPGLKRHKFVLATASNLARARTDDRGILQARYDRPCLDVRVSKSTLDRALAVMNAVILALESEGFPVTLAW